jgi:hypothetical protein
MTVLRADIEKALDDLISNEEGLRFQGLAVVLAKQHWPELVASERKKDLGADAVGSGRVLACSLTATLGKLKSDAAKIKKSFPNVTALIFATPQRLSNTVAHGWAEEIKKAFGYDLIVVSREDIVTSLLDPSNLALCRAHLGVSVTLDASAVDQGRQVRDAIAEVSTAWSRPLQGRPLIDLRAVRMNEDGSDTAEIVSHADAVATLARSGRMVIEAPAGRGKTTTLLQLANRHNGSGGVAVLVDLPGWIRSGKGLLQFISETLPFQSRGLTAEALARLHVQEPFSFLLNGWNEIGESDSLNGAQALRDLQRDFRSAGIVVATRTHHIAPPLPGATRLRLLPLNGAERRAYLDARLKERGRELDAILRGDAVLDELTRTPLILSEVTALFEAGNPIPKTKIGILEAATKLHEQSQDHAGHLAVAPLGGRATQYLTALAMAMMEEGAVTMTEQATRGVVSKVSARLNKDGQIASVPEPLAVIASLSAHHVLERVPSPADPVRFEHQQYQEFYAASELAGYIRELAAKGTKQEILEFTKKYINEPTWAEPLRMVAEEIGAATSETPADARAVNAGAVLVARAFDCDPVFGGELAFLCGSRVWKKVAGDASKKLRGLYDAGGHQREVALTGMLATGSGEFSDIILPLFSSADQQVRLSTYRLWADFHLSSLGPDWQKTVRAWPEEIRAEFVSDLIHFGNAARTLVPFALADESVKVRVAAIDALAWISLEGMNQCLSERDDYTFRAAARQLPPEWVRGANRPRALAIFQKLYDETSEPLKRISLLMKASQLGETDISGRLKQELDKCEPAQAKQLVDFRLKPILDTIRGNDPEWVSRWIAERIVDGTLWHDYWISYVTSIPPEMRESLLKQLETEDLQHARRGSGISILAAVPDNAMVQRVFGKLCELRQKITSEPERRHELEWAVERQLEDLFRLLPAKDAVEGLTSELTGDIEARRLIVVCRLFSRVGREDTDLREELSDSLRQMLRTYLLKGVPVMLQQEDFSGSMKADLASALARVGEAEDLASLHELIKADIERLRKGREARAKGDRGKQGNGASMSYSNWHTRALARLAPDHADSVLLELLKVPEYERDAAATLVQLTRAPEPQKLVNPFGRKGNYSEMWEARTKLQPTGFNEERRKLYAEAIRDELENLLEAGKQGGTVNDYRVKELAKVLAILDGLGSKDLIFRALHVSGRFNGWQLVETLETLLFSGVTLPTEQTLTLFNAIEEQVRPNRWNDNERHLLMKALCLLPFLDQQAAGIKRIQEVVSSLKIRGYELREVVSALGQCRCSEALPALCNLAADEITAKAVGDEWIDALAVLDTAEARKVLLSLVDPEIKGGSFPVAFDRSETVAARLVELARREPDIEPRLSQLCSLRVPEPKRSLLAKVMAWLGTPDAALSALNLLDDEATPQIPYDTWKQMEDAFVERKPYGKDTNSYTLSPRSSNEVRVRLFEMSKQDKFRAKAAAGLLAQIEAWRLEHGRPAGEPRSVEVECESSWPTVPVTELQPDSVKVN